MFWYLSNLRVSTNDRAIIISKLWTKLLTLDCTLDKCHSALNFDKFYGSEKFQIKLRVLKASFFVIVRTFFNIKTQLKVNFHLKKSCFLYFLPFLTIFHGKKLSYQRNFLKRNIKTRLFSA
jgi:hypothetical protein